MGKASKFDMGAFVQSLTPVEPAPAPLAAEARSRKSLADEIIQRKKNAGNEIIAIGECLIEAKSTIPHGEWGDFLQEVDIEERAAQRFMRLAREFSNPTALSDLGATKALALLTLPPKEREAFMEETHLVGGEEKTVIDMTSRELKKALKERDEARTAAEAAQADARSAEDSRAKMAADMAALKELHASAQEAEAQARDALAAAQAELKALRDKPVDVAVETVVDEEAAKRARAEAITEMQAKVSRAETARNAAEEKRASAEDELKQLRRQLSANAEILSRAEATERELSETRRQLEAAERTAKRAELNQNADLAMFAALFDQVQEPINKMRGLYLKIRGKNAAEGEKLKTAVLALANMVRGIAE